MATEGLDDINKAFELIGRAAQLKVMRRSLNAALNPALKELRANAPKGSKPHKTYKGRAVAPGFLSRSIKKSTRISRDKSRVLGNVRLASEAWYGSLLEHGWRPGKRTSKIKKASRRTKGGLTSANLSSLGDSRKKKVGNKWFSKVINRVSEPTLEAYSDRVEREIMKEWAK
jgi:ribosomal protein L32